MIGNPYSGRRPSSSLDQSFFTEDLANKSSYQTAKALAQDYQDQKAELERKQNRRGLFGSILGAIGTGASFLPIPGASVIGAGLKGIGEAIG